MVDAIFKFMDRLPPLKRRTSPNLACFAGLVLGGLALDLYFRSVVDFVIPIGIALVVVVVAGAAAAAELGWIGGAVIAALYGYFRSENSNRKLAAAETAGPAPAAA
jgi:hypothetical protein